MADEVDKTHPKYDSNIEAEQRKLKSLGHFKGKIDGVDGPKTQAARDAFKLDEAANADRKAEREEKARADKLRERELKIKEEELKQSGKKQDSEDAEAKAKRERREEYARQETSPEGMTAKGAASIITPALTTSAGYGLGGKLNERLDRAQEGRNVTLRGAAEDRVKGLTTREGAVTGTKLAGAMPFSNPLMRSTARMAPHLGLASVAFGKGAEHLSGYDEDQPYYSRMADRAAGLGYIGFGAGLGKRGIEYAASPGVSPDAQALSVINSSQLRRNPAANAQVNRLLQAQQTPSTPLQTVPPAAPPPPQSQPSQPPQQHSARLANAVTATGGKPSKSKAANYQALQKSINDGNAAEVAKALNLPEGTSRRTIMQRARELVSTRGVSSWALPFAAGAFAYSMTPEEAQASTGEQEAQPVPRENAYSGSPDDDFAYGQGTPSGGLNEEALTNAGVVTGLAYGMNRLIPRGAGTLIGGAMGPVAAMTGPDFTPETEKFAANAAVRDMPWVRHVLPGHQEAYDMAQVPERNPARVYENAYAPGGQPSGYGQPQQPDSFEADIAELQRLLSEMEAGGGQPMPQPQFRVPPAPTGPQNRLLAVR